MIMMWFVMFQQGFVCFSRCRLFSCCVVLKFHRFSKCVCVCVSLWYLLITSWLLVVDSFAFCLLFPEALVFSNVFVFIFVYTFVFVYSFVFFFVFSFVFLVVSCLHLYFGLSSVLSFFCFFNYFVGWWVVWD